MVNETIGRAAMSSRRSFIISENYRTGFQITTLLTTSLARPAFGADAAGAGADDLVAPAMGAGDVHEHVPERFGHAFGMSPAVRHPRRLTLVRRVVCDHVDQLLLRR